MSELYREITTCRSCGSTKLETVLDLGTLAISDFVLPGEREDQAPLELVVCTSCSLVQLRHTVDRDRLYRSYYYRSGTNEHMVAALRDVVEDACKRVELVKGDAVLDIGSNDSTLLRMYPRHLKRRGFEPSNIRPTKEPCITVWGDYFPPPWWRAPGWDVSFKIITSIACFYDLDDPNEFVKAIKGWLHPDGVWVVQFQDLHEMLSANGFDNICHEHLTYWGRGAFYNLVAKHGLRVLDVSHNSVNGGSVRYIVGHGNWAPPPVPEVRAVEFRTQLGNFSCDVERLKGQTLDLLLRLKAEGKMVLGYGASTKGNTTLQYYGIGPDLISMIADRNPDKFLRFTVGTHIPIVSEQHMRNMKPDYLFVLPWHFIDGFLEREREFLERRGKFIVPLPQLRIIGGVPCQSSTVGDFDKTLGPAGFVTL